MSRAGYDAIVVGAGPNGLASAIVLARAGFSVLVCERRERCGGGTYSAEITLPGFLHDVCSAVYPLALSSPFLQRLQLAQMGLGWVHSPAPVAHPLDDGTAVLLHRSLEVTSQGLGADGPAYFRLFHPLVRKWDRLETMVLGPARFPANPLLLARFGVTALLSARTLSRLLFRQERARALFAGLAAHSTLPLELPVSAAFGLVLGIAGHAVGWPVARGGAQQIADTLVRCLRSAGGEIRTATHVETLEQLPRARVVLFDLTPKQLLAIAGQRFPAKYQRKLNQFRYGAGAFKVDWALDAPIPWLARECLGAATVHLGGTLAEIAASERTATENHHAERPFVLLAQPSLFDRSRAPDGKHTVWAYCHVPNGSRADMTSRIEAQIERFAPGFSNRILARHVMPPAELESHNPNLVGGDINGGVQDIRQLFTRPTRSLYATPAKGLYICSSSTPPGGGVHGMCGYFAAKNALKRSLEVQA